METVALRVVETEQGAGTFDALLELLDEAELRLTEAERRLAKVAAALREDDGRAA